MAREPNLSDDLAVLAEEDRGRLGDAPSTEQLIALRDGRLSEEETERVRDRLTVDPELAALYLDLKRFPDLSASGEPGPSTDVDEAWRQLSAKLDRDAPRAEPAEEGRVVAFRRRRPRRTLLALAATLILAAGLAWFWATRPEPLPDGDYFDVDLSETVVRGPLLRVPTSAVGVAFQLEATSLEAPGRYVVELLDSSGRSIRRQRERLDVGQRVLVLRVASSSLKDGRSYRLTVRVSGAPESEPPAVDVKFTIDFEELELSESNAEAADCTEPEAIVDAALARRKKGEREAAGVAYEQALGLAAERGCAFQEARASNGLGTLATLESRLLDGLSLFDKALSGLHESSSSPSVDPAEAARLEAVIELNRASTLFRLGLLDDASDAHRRVRSLYRLLDVSEEEWAEVLLQAARVHRSRGQPREAEQAALEALERLGDTVSKSRGALWQELAWIYLEDQRFDGAERALDKALESLEHTSDELSRANVFVDRAELAARRGRWSECLAEVERAQSAKAKAQSADLHLETLLRHLRSLALWELGEPQSARLASMTGLALLEALHTGWRELGIYFFAMRQKYYRHRLDVAAAVEGPDEAWEVFESYRARGLLESSRLRADSASTAPDPAWQQRWKEERDGLIEAVAALDQWDTADGEEVLGYHEARFRAQLLALRKLRAETFSERGARSSRLATPEDVVRWLDEETLGLTFAAGKRKLHAITIDRLHGVGLRTLDVTDGHVEELVGQLLRCLSPHASTESRVAIESSVEELSGHLLSPLAERLGEFRRLVIVADSSLEQLPFEVLRNPRTGDRLVETHEISYLPSFSFLVASEARNRACQRPGKVLFAMGDPVFGPNDPRWPAGVDGPRNADEDLAWGRLVASGHEVRTLAELYGSASTVVTGSEATRRRFLSEAPKHRILHLASHARSHSEVPERSRIALSCIDERGRLVEPCDLYFTDAVNLDLCGQVVVLSACETAGGRPVEGEGTLGLPWTFLHAGAATVVASLWQVSDEHTAELMVAFHRSLGAGAAPAEALHRAKLERIAAGAPTFAWAPFVVLGNGRMNV